MVVEAKTAARHLLRALLRAATYLPDRDARLFIHEHTITRFRRAAGPTKARLSTGRQALHQLQRACDGNRAALLNVLELTYGRVGPRKRLWLDRLRALSHNEEDEPPVEDDKAESKSGIRLLDKEPSNRESPGKESHQTAGDTTEASPPQHTPVSQKDSTAALLVLQQLLISQTRNVKNGNHYLKNHTPNVPKTNSWGRPMPQCRVRNMTRAFWVHAFKRVLPPPPDHYWYRLRELSLGIVPFEKPPVRRSGPAGSLESDAGTAFSFPNAPARHLLRANRLDEQGHNITPRYMRRLWKEIWALCPLMRSPVEAGGRWNITWGGADLGDRKPAALKDADLALFDGLDDSQLQAKAPRGRRKSRHWI